ncbi:ribonuclease H-like domain-containing protein [Tanacetum coccineum]
MDPNSSLGKICLGENVVEISSDKIERSRDWDSPEYQDTANSGGKKETKAMVFHKMDTEKNSDRFVAPCFVNGLEAYDEEINLGVEENMISNEYAVKLCLEHEVKKRNHLVNVWVHCCTRGEIFFVKKIINPEEDDVEPGVIFGRSFLRMTIAITDFGAGTITIYPDIDPFLEDTKEEEKSMDDWDQLLDFNLDDIPLLGGEELPMFVCKMEKSSRNKKRAMENLNLFYQDIGTSSSTRRHLTQEEAVKEALAIRISQKFALLEEVRPVLEIMAHHDKYKKVFDEIWKDKVELDGMIMKEEEEAIKKGREEMKKVDRGITMINHTQTEAMGTLTNVLCQVGVTTLIAKFMILDIPINRDAPIVVGRGFLCMIGGIVNTPERLFSTFDGFCHQTFRDARSDTMGENDVEAESSRSKCSRQFETIEEVLLTQVDHDFLLWEGCNNEAKSRKSRVLTDVVLRSLSATIYYRDLDTTTLRELIDPEGRLILEDLQPGVPIVGIPRPPRASMQDLYDRMGSMEIRKEAIDGSYSTPGYAQPQYDQYCKQHPPPPPQYPLQYQQQQQDDDEKLLKTLCLDESSSPEFNLCSNLEEYSKEEVAEIMAETMEQYMGKTRADYGSGIPRPKIDDKDSFELKGQFLKELRDNTFSGSDHEDANEHIEKVLEIVDLFHIPNKTQDQVMLRAFPVSLTGAMSHWLRNKPSGSITTWEDLKTKFLSKYCPPTRTAKKMVEINNFKQEPDETLYQACKRFKELLMKCPQYYLTEMQEVIVFYNGLDVQNRQILDSKAIQAQLNNLGREIKNVNEKVYAAQVGCEQFKGPHYTKDCPLKKEAAPRFYRRNNANPSYQEQRQYMEETLSKFMSESAKRREENSNMIKDIRASTDAAERGFGSLPSSTEANPRVHVKSISTTAKADSNSMRRIGSPQYAVFTPQNRIFMFESRQTTIPFPSCLNDYYCEEKKGSNGTQFSKAYSYEASHIDKSIPRKEKDLGNFIILDMPEDVKVPLILGRPFLSTAHAKIDVLKRKIIFRVGDEKIIFKSVKPTSSLIKRVYMLSLKERMELYLEARLMEETLVLNRSLDPLYRDYIELNNPNVPLELRRDQVDDLMPTIKEGEWWKIWTATEIKTWKILFLENRSAKLHVWKQKGNIMDEVDIEDLTIEQYLRLTQENQTPKKIKDMTIAEYVKYKKMMNENHISNTKSYLPTYFGKSAPTYDPIREFAHYFGPNQPGA